MQVKQKISYFLSVNFIICLITFFLFSISAFSQKNKRQLEINQFVRLDWYPKFQYSINPSNFNTVKIHGTSFGTDFSYKFLFKDKFYFKSGLGYYKYSFNKIHQTNSLFGKSNNRIIDEYVPPGGPVPIITFTTDKYFYNSGSFRIGLGVYKNISKEFVINYGIGLASYYTFSQKYHIRYPSPDGNDYKTSVSRFFGFSSYGQISFEKRIDKISIGPNLDLPIYDTWKMDRVFPQETNKENRSKWLNGLTVGFRLTYYF